MRRVLQSPTGLLNAFCGASACLWFLLLAVTFTDRSLFILAISFAWGLAVGLTLLLAIALSRQRLAWWRSGLIFGVWVAGTLFVSNDVVGRWQTAHRLWSGFLFDTRYGWYPEPQLRQRRLLIPHGSYVASTDELGHRNPLKYPKDHVLPVVLQGDSNAFGFGLAEDETLSAVLNALRPEQPVYNVGVPGFDLNQYYYQYVELAQKFEIKRRIIHWNIGNDFTLSALETPNFFRRPYLYVADHMVRFASDFQAPLPVQGYGQSFIPPYREYDGLIRTVADDWADLYPASMIRLPLSRQLIRTYHPKICRLGELLFKKAPSLELFAPGWMLLKREFWPPPFDRYADDLPRLLRVLKRQNPSLTICVFPFREQVIPAELAVKQRELLAAGYAEADLEPLAFNHYFQLICDRESIELVDPTPLFLKVEDPAGLYQDGDQHLSAAGMRLCAAALTMALK